MRNIVDTNKIKITQGTIFSNVNAEDYSSNEVYGLIINARCDLEHGKFRKVSYLPIVQLDHWMAQDGLTLARERLEKDYMNSIQQKLVMNGHSANLLTFIEPDTIKNKLLKDDRNICLTLDKYISMKETKNQMLPSIINADITKVLKKVKADLLDYKLPGFYFLENIGFTSSSGYVVLLDEIKFLPSKFLILIKKGFTPDSNDAGINNVFREQTFTSMLGTITSPFIEHLMQQFSQMFIRIGIEEIHNKNLYL